MARSRVTVLSVGSSDPIIITVDSLCSRTPGHPVISLRLVLLLLGAGCFALAAFRIPVPPRGNFAAAGLFLWALAEMI